MKCVSKCEIAFEKVFQSLELLLKSVSKCLDVMSIDCILNEALALRRDRGCVMVGHGERSRLQSHFKKGGTENFSILVVNVLAVNRPLPPLYSVKKCLLHSM